MKSEQLDLFDWAQNRPIAEVINFIPHVVRQIIRQRGQPRIDRGGTLVDFPRAMSITRRSA
ncbi:hypothetical protein X769_18270 [Mesorhizobium sp. LSJC268A00]|nr:hypothetical protein X769_18270 [Mesorhizobium sp. LSJC268A00]